MFGDAQGRRILIAWMAMWESEMPEQKDNWAGAMTIPRELSLKDGQILCNPVPELIKLRQSLVHYEHFTISGEQELANISGDSYELEVQINSKSASQFGIKLRVDQENHQETILTYDINEGLLSFDRDKSGQGPTGVRKAPVQLRDNTLYLRIFVDKSSVEVFINEGEKVMTARIYPGEEATGIRFFGDKEIELTFLNKWSLKKEFNH